VGVHAAADTEYDWAYYGNLVGAWFQSHPAIQTATVRTEDRAHAATSHLGATWSRSDEWYSYRTNPRSSVKVLQNLDEGSYSGGGMGDHPITWCKTIMQRPQLLHRPRPHPGQLQRGQLPDAAPRRHPVRGRLGQAGLPGGDGLHPDLQRLHHGLVAAGPGNFTNTDATLKSVGGMGLLWYSAKEYASYSLKADWKMDGDDNSGIFVGFPSSTDVNSAVNNGYEIQIDSTDTVDKTTGSIYGFKSADVAARDAALNPPGTWNTYELLVEGRAAPGLPERPPDQRLHQHRGQQVSGAGLHRPAEPRHR